MLRLMKLRSLSLGWRFRDPCLGATPDAVRGVGGGEQPPLLPVSASAAVAQGQTARVLPGR